MTADELPPELLAARERVDAELDRYLDTALARITGHHPALEPAADELRAFVIGGGKRLRPLFLLSGYVAGGETATADVMGAALALELLHTCALLHDDVIDAAPTRRGRPTAHERFAVHHREHGYFGEPGAFGEAVAILLGDLAFVHADEAFLQCDLPPQRLLDGLRVFTTLREEVMAGQYLDVVAAHQQRGASGLALQVASLKSGRYTIARPLQLGATLAGAPRIADELYELGLPLGVAFQLRDDLLGVFGTEDDTGKSAASDLREGKRTLLVTETLARLDHEAAARFTQLLGATDLDDGGVTELRTVIERSGGRAAVETRIDALTTDARRKLEALDVAAPADAWLDALAGWVVSRAS